MITVFERRNKVSSSTLNQRFWVDSKKQFCSYAMIFEKIKSLY